MSKTRKALHALVVLAFLTSLFALAIGEIVPNPDDFARKIMDVRQSDASFDRSLKANPNQFGPKSDMDRTGYVTEGFEGGVVPPTGWTLTQYNPVETWEIDTYDPYTGVYNASCFYDATYTDVQDEWLISPVMNFASATSDLKLGFAWLMSYYWSVDPYDSYDLQVHITTDGTAWTQIWSEHSEGVFASWTWYEKVISLSSYTGTGYETVQVAFVYDGYDGAQASIDDIYVDDDAAPIGRCCYGDPAAPSCADNTELECDGLGGDWDGALNCTDDPCPVAGPNDLCTGAIAMTSGGTYTGTTAGATVDCPGVLDWNAVWYSFYVEECVFATMDYCNVSPQYDVECLGVVVYDECPEDCPNYILYTSNEWVSCPPAPSTQPITHFDFLPGPMTYYYPVFMGDAECVPVEKQFSFVFTLVDCPEAQDGDNCDMPLGVEIPADLRGEYVDVNTTCGRLDYYGGQSTCLGYYDQGEEIIYEITVTEETCVDILVDPDDVYSGFALSEVCPPADPCIIATAGYSDAEYGVYNVTAAAGTYYLMIDTWPLPTCVDFTLTIKECEPTTPGNTCEDPIIVKLPADIPYADLGQKTCMRVDDYNMTCMGYYDGGEDAIYKLEVTEDVAVIITMDPKTSTWSGLALDDNCPLDGDPGCLAVVTGSAAAPRVIEYPLSAGDYWVMVDTWPSPACLPDFDLTIDLGPDAEITPTSFDFGTVNAGDNGSEILNIANVGGGFLNYEIEVTYTPPREIDGAYVEALDAYKPGMTMDIEFFAANASSDAEWIDEIVLEFPAGCDVIGSTNFDVIGATRYLECEGQTGDGAHVVYWNWDGGYGNMYSSDEALATVTIAFAGSKSGDISVPYTMSGDDFGSEPHDISGVLTIAEADPMTSWLVCAPTSGSVAGGTSDDVTAAWDATGLPNDTYDADINVSHNAKETIPATITVTNGMQKAKIAPDPAYIYMKYAFDPMDLTVYVGHFNGSDTPGDVTDLTVNGIAATIVGTTTHPSFTGDVLEATVPAAPFLDPYGGPIGTVLKSFDVAGTVNGSPFTGKGKVALHGKDAKTGGKTWMVPPDMVLFHGDANLDGYIDIDDAVATIEVIFVGGQIIGPLTIADCDCSHSVDIDDVVYLVQYIFNQGPAPCHD